MEKPSEQSIVEAMKYDLGASRVDDLKLENGRKGHAVRVGAIHSSIANVTAPIPPRKPQNSLANKWYNAISKGEFDDDDAEAVKGLDRICGGRLHALSSNQQPLAQSYPNHRQYNELSNTSFAQPANGFYAGRLSSHQTAPCPVKPSSMGARLPGQYAAPYLARAPNMGVGMSGQYAAPNPVSFSNIGAGGPVQRLAPGQAQSTAGRRHIPDYPIQLAPVQRIAHQSQGPQNPARSATLTYGITDNKTTAPQVPSHDNRSKSSLQGFAGQVSAAATEQPPILFTPDPVPSEYFHKASIRVADRLAKGNGVAYLLEKSPTDTGTFSVFLEGLKYLEYPILDMVNYIANSQELYPQFKEADGVSIITTSLVFGCQSEIALFMSKVRALQERRPAVPDTKSDDILPANEITAGICAPLEPSRANLNKIPCSPGSASSDFLPEPKRQRPAVFAETETKERLVKQSGGTAQGEKATASNRTTWSKYFPSTLAAGESRECAASKAAAPKKDVCTPATSKTAPTTHASAGAALEASLVDLSLSPQVLPPRRITSSGSVSSYAMDLGTLDFAVKDCDNEQSQSAQVDETDDLARDLQQILPTFKKVSQALVSISESKRELAAKRVLQNLKGASGADELLRTLLLLSAKSGAEASLETAPSCCGPKYSLKELLHLRSSACIPPKWVFHTGFLPVRPQRNAETRIKATGEGGQPQKTKENETVTNVNAGTQMDREQDSMSMTSILTALVDIMKTPVSMLDNCENPTAVPEVSQVVPSTPVKQKSTVGTDRGNSVTKGLNSSRWA